MDRSAIILPIGPNLKNYMDNKCLVIQVFYFVEGTEQEDFVLVHTTRVRVNPALAWAERWFETAYRGRGHKVSRLNLYSGFLGDGVRVLKGIDEREEEGEVFPWN